MGGAGVEVPPISLVVAGAVAERDEYLRLIKVEESRCGRCRWRKLDACVCQEQSRLFLLHLCDVGLATSWLSTVFGPMAKLATVAAGVVSCRLVVAGGAALGTSASATLGASSRPPQLDTSACLARLAAAYRGRRLPLSSVTLRGLPLLPSEMELPANGDRPRERLWLIIVDDLEATQRLLNRHRGEVQQRLDRASDLPVLLWDAVEELLDSSLLVVGVVVALHHLLQKIVETEGKVINILTWLEGQVLPLLAECLQRGLAGAVAADACRSDSVPGLLGSPLLGKRELHLGRDCSDEGIQRPSIFVVVDVAVPDCLPHVSHLEPHPHHRGPLDVVGFGEGRPPSAGTKVPDHRLNAVVAMAPVRGGRAALPARAALSVEPATSTGSATAARALRAGAGTPAPVWVPVSGRAVPWVTAAAVGVGCCPPLSPAPAPFLLPAPQTPCRR
nr:uncharacterized protein LOC107280154 [Oryza sativa Japonica Group]